MGVLEVEAAGPRLVILSKAAGRGFEWPWRLCKKSKGLAESQRTKLKQNPGAFNPGSRDVGDFVGCLSSGGAMGSQRGNGSIVTREISVIGLAWFLVAIALAASGALQHLRPPGPQIVIVALTAGLLIAWRVNRAFQAWLDALDLRAVIALHLTRFVGVYFLFLYGKGELPFSFAVPGGWGYSGRHFGGHFVAWLVSCRASSRLVGHLESGRICRHHVCGGVGSEAGNERSRFDGGAVAIAAEFAPDVSGAVDHRQPRSHLRPAATRSALKTARRAFHAQSQTCALDQ
jgi:hypothetical protein